MYHKTQQQQQQQLRMNESQRAVLQRHYRHLADDIILTDNLLAALYQQHIFERNMIELIKSEKSEAEKVCRMLDMLPKRGPAAFDKFVSIIQHDYPWLSAMLINSLKEEKMTRAPTRASSRVTEQMRLESERTSIDISALELDGDIKTRVSTYVHKQFGQSKRISENDKKSLIRWLGIQLQCERERAPSSSSGSSSSSTVIIVTADKCVGTDDVIGGSANQTQLNNRVQYLFDKFEEYKRSSNIPRGSESRCSEIGSQSSGDRKSSKDGYGGPKDMVKPPMTPVTLDNVLSEVDYLLDKVKDLEDEISKCHTLLGDNERTLSLSLLIYDMTTKLSNKEKEIKQEKGKTDRMLTELYENSKKITRLEHTVTQQRSLLQHQSSENEKIIRESQHLKDQIVQLEQLSQYTAEANGYNSLRHMLRDVRGSRVNKAESVRTSTDSIGRSSRVQSNRGYSPSKSMASTGFQSNRYNNSKPRVAQTNNSEGVTNGRKSNLSFNSRVNKRKT